MTLETWSTPGELYLARGEDVNPYRPLLTGDVFRDVDIPGVQTGGMGIIVAHPCSMRAKGARLQDSLLMAAVAASGRIGKAAWETGYTGLMPLPDLREPDSLCVAKLDDVGKARTDQLAQVERIACLSPYGVNLLQQRLIWRLTRFEVPTHSLQEVSVHVYEEADLLEEWTEELCERGVTSEQAAAEFEELMRADRDDGRTLQDRLRGPQSRASVRAACRAELRRLRGSP